jgi:predicted RNase H-like HicB family nuclease
MKYPILIEPGNEKTAYGVIVPDLPGCFSAGDSLKEARTNAKTAIEVWMSHQIEDGKPIPEASAPETYEDEARDEGWILETVEIH